MRAHDCLLILPFLIIFLLNFYVFFIFVDVVYHFLVGIIFPLKTLGIILNNTMRRCFWPTHWHTALSLGTRTSGKCAKGAKGAKGALLCRVTSVNCFSITKDLSQSAGICTLFPEILSSHIFPLVVSFKWLVINLTLQARLGLVYYTTGFSTFTYITVRGKRAKNANSSVVRQ